MDLRGLLLRSLLYTFYRSISLCVGNVTLLPSSIDVWEYSDVTFHCTNQAQHMEAVRWYKDSHVAALDIQDNTCQAYGFLRNQTLYSFSCIDNTTFSVTLKNVSRKNNNEQWKCNHHYWNESNVVTIFVKVPAKIANLFPRQNVLTAVENETFSSLHCISNECRPQPTFLWYKDHNTDSREDDILLLEDISSSNTSSTIQNYTSTLLFTPSRSMNGWYIFCAVNNSLAENSVSEKILLNITYFPNLKLMTKMLTEGDNFTYWCNVSNGSPEFTTVTWNKADQIWYGQQLTLNNVSRTQAGKYLCRANNITIKSEGSQVSSRKIEYLQLYVEYRAKVLNILANANNNSFSTDNFTVSENELVFLTCNIEGNPLPEGEMKFLEANYIRNTNTVVEINNSLKQNSTNLQLVTHLYAKCTEAGQYTCNGWNTLYNGMRTASNESLKLFVKCTPRLSPLHEIHDHVFCALSSDVTLSFTALAYPVPPVSGFIWYKKDLEGNWETINSSSLSDKQTTVSTYGLQSNLTITNITQLDYGLYMLMIENEVGTYEHTFNISATSQLVDDDQKLVILAGATVGTVVSVLVLLTIFVAVIVIRRSSQHQNAGVTTEPREVDGSQATHNFFQVVNTNSPSNGGYPNFYEELQNAVVANYCSLKDDKPNIYEELPNAGQEQQNAYENMKMTRTKTAP